MAELSELPRAGVKRFRPLRRWAVSLRNLLGVHSPRRARTILSVAITLAVLATALVAVGPLEQAQADVCTDPSTMTGSAEQYRLTQNRNVRSGPSTSCGQITTLNSGATLTARGPVVEANGFRWRPVTSGSTSGWCCS